MILIIAFCMVIFFFSFFFFFIIFFFLHVFLPAFKLSCFYTLVDSNFQLIFLFVYNTLPLFLYFGFIKLIYWINISYMLVWNKDNVIRIWEKFAFFFTWKIGIKEISWSHSSHLFDFVSSGLTKNKYSDILLDYLLRQTF